MTTFHLSLSTEEVAKLISLISKEDSGLSHLTSQLERQIEEQQGVDEDSDEGALHVETEDIDSAKANDSEHEGRKRKRTRQVSEAAQVAEEPEIIPSTRKKCKRNATTNKKAAQVPRSALVDAEVGTEWAMTETRVPQPVSGSAVYWLTTIHGNIIQRSGDILELASNWKKESVTEKTVTNDKIADAVLACQFYDMVASKSRIASYLQYIVVYLYQVETRLNMKEFAEAYKTVKITTGKIKAWLRFGKRLAQLCYGGTIYVLFLLSDAAFDRLTEVPEDVTKNICDVLRAPNEGNVGSLTGDIIVPMIGRVKLACAFSAKALLGIGSDESPDYLLESDEIFKMSLDGTFAISRDQDSWSICSASRLFVRTEIQAVLGDALIVQTGYDPSHVDNRSSAASFLDEKGSDIWTEKERLLVDQKARRVTTFVAAQEALKEQLDSGVKERGKYVWITREAFCEKTLLIKDKNDDVIALFSAELAEDMRQHLLQIIEGLYPTILVDLDSKRLPNDHPFYARHYSIYNRYAPDGSDAPRDVDADYLVKVDKRTLPIHCWVPHTSNEWKEDHPKVYEIHRQLAHQFAFIEMLIQKHLGKEYEILNAYVDVLPNPTDVGVAPFIGMVLNINVRTRGHLDKFDKSICLVFVISKCKGGELALVEPGIVVELNNGDFAAFRSSQTTHFNMDFVGKRCSLVLHSDSAMESYKNNGNGWKGSKSFVV